VTINGRPQPGDEDSTRTYELAAAGCFFIHRATNLMRQLYSEREVALFATASDLAHKINWFLSHEDERREMAAAAHRRAVPAYSLDRRAAQVLDVIAARVARRVSK
jgi:spore maturation protein CgeB